MSTSTPEKTGTSFFKTLAIVIGILVLICIGWSLVKSLIGLLWVALVIVGAVTVVKFLASK